MTRAMQARYAGLSDELRSTISALNSMTTKSEEIAGMTANVITGSYMLLGRT